MITPSFLRGGAYEGEGGPEHKTARAYQENPGKIDESAVKGRGKNPKNVEGATLRNRDELLPSDQVLGGRGREPVHRGEVTEQGRLASKANLGMSAISREELPSQGAKGSMYRGRDWKAPESVPDQRADQGEIPPASVIETSHNI